MVVDERHYTKHELIEGFPVPGARLAPIHERLGPLAMLPGTWKGQGNTMLATPARQGLFRAIGHPVTNETLTYIAGAPAPDRGGFDQPDVFLTGVRYHHQVNDAKTNEAIHDEMGFWLNVPATVEPEARAGLIREFTIPHGNAGIMYGAATRLDGQAYAFPPLHAIPTPRENFPSPDIYDSDNTGDVNQQLNEAQAGLTYRESEVISVQTSGPGDIVNIPFLTKQASSISASATFVISIVSHEHGDPFYMLQYTQTIMLQFPALKNGPMINWPHVAVATLFKVE